MSHDLLVQVAYCAGDLLNDVRMRSLTNFCPAQNRRDKNSATETNLT